MLRLDPIAADADHPQLNPVFDVFRDAGREVPLLYRLLANAPSMLEAWVGLAWPLRSEPVTSRALRELVIMRVALLTRASFEWQAHWPAARSAGVSREQLARLPTWAEADEFSAAERAALRCTDEMIEDGGASEEAMEQLRAHYSDGECVELILTGAFYSCVSHTLSSLGVEADEAGTDPEPLMVYRELTT